MALAIHEAWLTHNYSSYLIRNKCDISIDVPEGLSLIFNSRLTIAHIEIHQYDAAISISGNLPSDIELRLGFLSNYHGLLGIKLSQTSLVIPGNNLCLTRGVGLLLIDTSHDVRPAFAYLCHPNQIRRTPQYY